MFSSLAFPHCYVDIYPFEGGLYSIQGDAGGLLNCSVESNIRNGYGTFSLALAPGGPYGPNVSPQWTDVITPMSLVVIGMQRAGRSRIVLIGVVRTISETEVWNPASGVQRSISVTGFDFGYFFTLPNYYTLSLLNATIGAPLGSDGSLASIDQGLVYGTPDTVGAAWYKDIMAGPNSIMAKTTFSYQGSRPSFYDMVATYFQPYSDVDIVIPLGDNFMSADGTWMDKFRQLFPFPWYEFFVVTAPPGAYPGGSANVPISLTAPGFDPACVQLVARVNPLPWTKNLGSGSDLNLKIQFDKWDLLPQYQLDGNAGPIAKRVMNSEGELRNFYMVNTKWISNLFGLNNDNQTPFTWLFASWINTASMHRYGYRPEVAELHWFSDPDGVAAKQYAASGKGQNDFEAAIANLTLKKTSWHEPSVIMTQADISTNLRPDILPGNRFVCPIHKDNMLWEFYIEGVAHTYQFGGPAVTTLSLNRGLPIDVYNDEDLMLAMHIGNVQKVNGQYKVGLPQGIGQPLQPLNFSNMTAVIGQVAGVFAVPQAR
jgi:hypothetical protein